MLSAPTASPKRGRSWGIGCLTLRGRNDSGGLRGLPHGTSVGRGENVAPSRTKRARADSVTACARVTFRDIGRAVGIRRNS